MRKKRDSGGRFGAAAVLGLALLCLTLGGLTGCKDGEDLSGENKITSFKIGDAVGFIDDTAGEIKITVAPTEDVGKLTPVIEVSEKATVYPPSDAEVDISYIKEYTVTAENDDTRIYKVEVIRLESIAVDPLKITYDKGEAWDEADVVVTGVYSDGVTRQVTTGYTVVGYDPDKEGFQAVAVVLNGKTAAPYEVSVLELLSIEVVPLKTNYAYGSFFSPDDIKVVGSYSDGTKRILTEYTVIPYEDELETLTTAPLKGGIHDLLVAAYNGVNDLLEITVEDERVASISIGLPNTPDAQPVIFGLPSGDIVLSVTGSQKELVISAARVYSDVNWYVDNELKAGNNENIFTIKAAEYVLKKPHTLTFVGTRDDVEYSTDISFTVNWD